MRNRHFVVVQDDNQAAVRASRVIQPFIGEPSGQGAVTDHGNDIMIVLRKLFGGRQAICG